MSTLRYIRGLSRAGFRVPKSGGGYSKVSWSGATQVDIDDIKTQLVLNGERDNFIRVNNAGTFTVTIASPGVFTKNGHGFVAGDIVVFSTTGALPTGLTAGTKYYVISTGLSANSFRVSTTVGGSAVNTSGSQSGTHTVTPGSAWIFGLTRYGFRINGYVAGTNTVVKLGAAAKQVDLTDYRICRVLRRNYGRYGVSSSNSAITVRGTQAQQSGFEIGDDTAAATITITGDNSGDATATKTVTVGAKTYTLVSALTEVKASGTLTDSSTGPANNDTVTIGATTYTFKTSLTGAANEVLRTGVIDVALTNLASAVNGTAGAGTTYGTGTVANASVTAGSVSAHVLTLTAKSVGTAGNSIAFTKSAANLAISGSGTLTGGVNSVANEVKVTGTADNTLTALSEAINAGNNKGTDYSSATTANAQVSASAVASHAITLTALNNLEPQDIPVSTTETTYTVGNWGGGGVFGVYRLQSVTVNPQKPAIYTQLRRHYKSWIEG